jgi:gliding motility-associated protein GldL
MSAIDTLVQSKVFKKVMDKLYGFGASVVVMGALFKLEHWNGADYMLTAGLVTEAVIFFFYAFNSETEPESVEAELVESSNLGLNGLSTFSGDSQNAIGGNGFIALARFDKMIDEAQITPRMLQDLGHGMRKLGETAENMNSIGNVSVASNQYMNTIKSADKSLARLSKTYEKTISRVTLKTAVKYNSIADSLSVIEQEAQTYKHHMSSINKDLSDLSMVYRMQKREAFSYLNDMAESAADTKKYREEIKKLNENLSALNNVYGNMLNAMKSSNS